MCNVEIIERKTQKIIQSIPCVSVEQALKVERGLEINMNRKKYRTHIKMEKVPNAVLLPL